MSNTNLAAISSFEQLLPYLEANLDWPTKQYSFEDLTFEFEPEELGLKDADAAKIKSIHQLRPLKASQPFGIFFVEFENKKLPVFVLRRILSHLALKKRASANKTATPAWHAQDIIFISAYGEDGTDERELAFAHFHQSNGDLPTLRVLSWDCSDTPLKLAYVDRQLRSCLHWPTEEGDAAQWRSKWSSAFKHSPGYVIRTTDELAKTLAFFARKICDEMIDILRAESDRGAYHKLYKGFKTALIHDLTEESFADTYAQTITYGLLTAAISRTDKEGEEGTALVADNIADMVPVTNPFLKDMLETFLNTGGRKRGIDFDELGIQDVVELLRDREKTDLAAVLRDFNKKTQGEDPVIHFYENFLSAYNKKLKIQRGVFYTPQPVVSYIVRSVHELLQTEFGLEDGLASTVTWGEMLKRNPDLKLPDLSDDPKHPKPLPESEYFVQILDPATGTATFLVEAIDVIYNHLKAKWAKSGLASMPALPAGTANCNCKLFTDFWNIYVPKSLLPRLHGYELLMAPYAIAHMKIGLKLAETGYRFGTEERVRIYLTNALEPKDTKLPHIAIESLAHEAQAVNDIKWYKRFTVVIGNPPYDYDSQNNGKDIQLLVERYYQVNGRPLKEKNPRGLQDDYVKFVRLAETIVSQAGVGIFGFITNNSFFDNPTYRGMRFSLYTTYDKLWLLNIHGNTNVKALVLSTETDENVFKIKQAVGISFFAKTNTSHNICHYHEIYGLESSKIAFLNESSLVKGPWLEINPAPESWYFIPVKSEGKAEYESFFSLPEAMPVNSVGLYTARDNFVIAESRDVLWKRMNKFIELKPEQARNEFRLGDDSIDWRVKEAQSDVRLLGCQEKNILPIAYRPFDSQFTFYTGKSGGVICRPRPEVMSHLIAGKNRALCFLRRSREHLSSSFFVAHGLVDKTILSSADNAYIAPLFINSKPGELIFLNEIRFNFAPDFLEAIFSKLHLSSNPMHGLVNEVSPEDIFNYIYAVFHSPGYRTRYAEFLKNDFPRVPLTSSFELFRSLAALGGELVALHLMESPKLNSHITHWIGDQKQEIEKITYSDKTVWIDKAKSAGFEGVPENVWNFHIGGYQVCEKWLKDRKGRTLSDDDINHYHKIIVALSETIRLMSEIDTVITTHGGWPGAFVQDNKDT